MLVFEEENVEPTKQIIAFPLFKTEPSDSVGKFWHHYKRESRSYAIIKDIFNYSENYSWMFATIILHLFLFIISQFLFFLIFAYLSSKISNVLIKVVVSNRT
jgi:hypothetical protein